MLQFLTFIYNEDRFKKVLKTINESMIESIVAYSVLIVDDDNASREVFRQVLKMVGFKSTEAANGEIALRQLESSTPNLVVLDLRLPRVTGAEVLQYIYSAPHLQNTRVIIASAHEGMMARLDLRDGDRYLVKPISASLLRETALELTTAE